MKMTDDDGGGVSEMEPKTPTRAKGSEEEQLRKAIISRRRAVEYMGVPVPRMLREISLHNLIFQAHSPSNSPSPSPSPGGGGGGGNHGHCLRSNKLANPMTTTTTTTTSPRYNALLVLEKDDSGVENNKLLKRKIVDTFRPKVVQDLLITPIPVTPNRAAEEKPYRRKRKWQTLGKNVTESSYTPSQDIEDITIAQLKYQSKFSCRRALKFDCENMTMDQTKYLDVKAGSSHTTDQYGSSYNSKVHWMQKGSQVAAEEDTHFLSSRRGFSDMSSQIGRLAVPYKKASTRCSSLALLFKYLYDHTDREGTRGSEIILMGNDGTEGAKGKARDTNQEIRELETQLLLQRVETFMSTMKLIQGNGHFTRWKGSVVDSVAGAFLAQNVGDNLSSSAFMNLAAKYPTAKKSPFEGTRSKRVVNESKSSYLKIKTENGESQKTKKRKFDLIKKYEDLDSKTNWKSGKGKACKVKEENAIDWERLRKSSTKAEEASDNHRDIDGNSKDALDWHAVNCAELSEVSEAIECRGMNNKLAARIKKFLRRLKEEHGSLDLEWLRALPHQGAKEFLLSIRGLGTKSVECIRLLTLQHAAFPVDINVARIAVRLGWVPLEPLPEGVQLHHLKKYPIVNSVHKYLSKRLLCLEQKKLNELHFQMITFGKVICTKINPNCNACPLKGECKYFASAYTSAKFGLSVPRKNTSNASAGSTGMVPAEANLSNLRHQSDDVCGPVVTSTQPTPPRGKDTTMVVRDIEDLFHEKVPRITFNSEAFMKNVRNYIQENHITVREDELTEGLIDLISKGVFLPAKKQKINDNQRTKHIVYELPDSHSLLGRFDKREVDDKCPYLLATWTTGEIGNSSESPKEKRDSGQEEGQKLLGTLLIPCRTATRGIFPLDGTYFQTNEVFADHQTSLCPIKVPRELIHGLQEKTMYCGTSVRAIYGGLSIEEIVHCFWRGYICLRGFNRWTREPTRLAKALHTPKGSKIEKDSHEKKEVL